MFAVGFGSKNREDEIRRIAKHDPITAVVLASVHFEWMVKRAILKLGTAPTKGLREQLEGVFKIEGYKMFWEREVRPRLRDAALGRVIGRLTAVQNRAMKARGRIIHGNGTVGIKVAMDAIELFLEAGEKLRAFASRHGEDLDSVLTRRINPRDCK